MHNFLTDGNKKNLASATKQNLYSMFYRISQVHPVASFEKDPIICWHSRVDHPWFNGVISEDEPDSQASQMIDRIKNYFRQNGVHGISWWLPPNIPADEWSQKLITAGFQQDQNTPGMAINLSSLDQIPNSSHLEIQEINKYEDMKIWIDTFIEGYEIPESFSVPMHDLLKLMGLELPFRYYLGYQNGLPVATSTLFLGAGVAGIYNVATIAKARGQGIGTQMTIYPLHQMHLSGYYYGVLQSSEMGYQVYKGIGFEKVCNMDHFYWSTDR